MIVPLVEGDGDAAAVPVLLRRIIQAYYPDALGIQVGRPLVAHGRTRLLGEYGKFLGYARAKGGQCRGVLVLLDADEDCPKDLACELAGRALACNLPYPLAVVVARCEYEAWLLASASEMKDRLPRADRVKVPADLEGVRNPKSLLTEMMGPGRAHKETIDQARLSAKLNLSLAEENCRSFRRLLSAMGFLLQAVRDRSTGVTPISPSSER